ncbi:MAG: diguanylate cyclase, partial [Oscillospiraceae bacterium]
EAKGNEITVFVNCRITDNSGKVMGVVGVGIRVDSLQELLHDYEEKYGISACLINNTGKVEISSLKTGYENVNLFDEVEYSKNKENILGNRDTKQTFWYSSENGEGFVVTRYEPNLKWHLIVESDTTKICNTLTFQLSGGIVLIVFIIFMVMFTIIYVIKKYNAKVIELTVSEELEYQRLLHETTEGLYENIFEFDITHDRVEQEHTRAYFKGLGLDRDASYAKAIYAIANIQIKDEYRQGYLDVFLPKHVTEAYENGINNLNYDFMISDDGINYHWTRISARIFYWNSDKSIRMISYRKNIDDEKKREFMLLEGIQKDSMTGLYNKKAAEEKITEILKAAENTSEKYIFLILDVDNFKTLNDSKGHAF